MSISSLDSLIDGIRRREGAALQVLAETALPYVNAIALAQALEAPEPAAVFALFNEAAAVGAASTAPGVAGRVFDAARSRAESLKASNEPRVEHAMATFLRVSSLPAIEREVCAARLVERLTAGQIAEALRLPEPLVAAALQRSVALLLPHAQAVEVTYLLSLEGAGGDDLLQLENVLSALAADVSAFEAGAPASPAAVVERTLIDGGHQSQPAPASAAANLEQTADPVTIGVFELPTGARQQFAPPTLLTDEQAPARPPTQVFTMAQVKVSPALERRPPSSPSVPVQAASSPGQPRPMVDDGRTTRTPVPLPLALRDEPTAAAGVALSSETRVTRPPFVEVEATVPVGRALSEPPEPLRVSSTGWKWWLAAGVCGAIAWASATVALFFIERRTTASWSLRPVLVSAVDVDEGELLPMQTIAVRQVPASFVTTSVVSTESLSLLGEQRLRVKIQAGDPLLWSHFETAQAHQRLSKAVERRMRAISVAVSELKNVGGWAGPGERADFLLMVHAPKSAPGDRDALQGLTLLQAVSVLSVGKATVVSTSRTKKTYSNVSVLLLLEEAEVLSLAADVGDVTMSLRAPGDFETEPRDGVTTLKTLLDGEKMRRVAARRKDVIAHIRTAQPVSAP